MDRRVVVIGASSGIGRALAEYYASCGCKVGIAARREEYLKAIKERYPNNVHYVVMDVTDSSSLQLFNLLVGGIGGVDLVIYCSGAGRYSETLDPEIEHHTTAVNVNGFLNVVIAAFNYFAERGEQTLHKPQIVTISSVASIRGLAPTPSYSATKRFQTIYFEALEQKAHKIGLPITLTSIIPGFIATDFINRNYPLTMELPYAVHRIIRAIERRKRVAVIDWKWRLIVPLMRIIPPFVWKRLPI
ncbi:MAG: SDR family NAD(P)-dependent oxidoreductase [Bacteroidales bacterium]|nr:SDR family NAD(P)-dependent oxidoreductase [Bacteroidales bacterium]